MLRHWQSQQRRISRTTDRRFLGIQGEGHAPVNAIVNWNNGNPEWLSLVISAFKSAASYLRLSWAEYLSLRDGFYENPALSRSPS